MNSLKKIFQRKKKYVYRSSETGEFVTRLYALLHPATTIKEELK